MTPRTARVLIILALIIAAWVALHDFEALTEAVALGLAIALKRSTLP